MESITQQITSYLAKKIDEQIEDKLRERLADRGLHFLTQSEFYGFIQENVQRIQYQGRPSYLEFYLNWETAGGFLFSVNYETNLDIIRPDIQFEVLIKDEKQ